MIFDLVDVVLLSLVAAAITVIITKPSMRAAASGVLAFVIGLFAGRRVPPKIAEEPPPDPPEFEASDTPITVPIPNPNLELEEDLHDEYSTIDNLPVDDLADELARLEQRARQRFDD